MSNRFWWAVAGVVLTGSPAMAQTFVRVAAPPAEIAALPTFVRCEAGSVYRINWGLLQRDLDAGAGLPAGEATPAEQQPMMALPTPGGVTRWFHVVESPVMEPELSAKFPAIRTYRVRGVEDPSAVGRVDVTSHGLRGMIRTEAGTIFIDPYSARQREYVSVYWLHDFRGESDWVCGTGHEHGAGPADLEDEALATGTAGAAAPSGPQPLFGPTPMRTYRLAMACSGEYGAYQGEVQGRAPNAADALAAIVTVTNRSNVVFESDLGVRFLLVGNNDLLAFFDPATDPYPNADPSCTANPAADCSGPYLNANVTALNQIIGSANFDVGHVLTRVRGGVAGLRVVCGNSKARGVSGIPRGGEVEPVSALVPLHELGHQFGANHTFNGVLGRCNANINGTTNWEPGGGSTIMAYPGACPVGGTIGEGDTDNLVLFADPTFHSGSLMEMRTFLGGAAAGGCVATVDVGNAQAPVISALTPSGLAIPPLTPFRLSAAATDDGSSLTYAWDEMDVGPAQRLTGPTSEDNGTSALFRTYVPATAGERELPRRSDLVAGIAYIGERMPTAVGATRKFRVSVRDNQGASVTSALVNVVIADTMPLVVSEPAAGQVTRGPLVRVRWNAPAIAGPPVSTSAVEISLSLDAGLTFPTVLAAAPNSGDVVVDAGAAVSPTARVRVAAVGGIFYNLSGTFDLRAACSLDFNGDGNLDPDDLADYVTCFFSVPACGGADVNGDGNVDPDDLSDYITAFFAGCP